MLSHGELQLPPPLSMWRTARHRDGGIQLDDADFLYSPSSRSATPPGPVCSGELAGPGRARLVPGAGTAPGARGQPRFSALYLAVLLICAFPPGSRNASARSWTGIPSVLLRVRCLPVSARARTRGSDPLRSKQVQERRVVRAFM